MKINKNELKNMIREVLAEADIPTGYDSDTGVSSPGPWDDEWKASEEAGGMFLRGIDKGVHQRQRDAESKGQVTSAEDVHAADPAGAYQSLARQAETDDTALEELADAAQYNPRAQALLDAVLASRKKLQQESKRLTRQRLKRIIKEVYETLK